MVIGSAGWIDWAVPKPGPVHKKYSELNKLLAYIPHDMVGYYDGTGYSAVFDPARDASWNVSIGYDPQGHPTLWQHYSALVSTWTSGSPYWNTRGFTSETVRTEKPLRPYDPDPLPADLVDVHLRLIGDLEAFTGHSFVRAPKYGLSVLPTRRLVLEHREVSPPNKVTTCPNGRFANLYRALEYRNPMGITDTLTDDEWKEIVERFKAEGWLDDIGPTDKRFRELDSLRYALIRAAMHSDGTRVENIYKAVKAAGFTLD